MHARRSHKPSRLYVAGWEVPSRAATAGEPGTVLREHRAGEACRARGSQGCSSFEPTAELAPHTPQSFDPSPSRRLGDRHLCRTSDTACLCHRMTRRLHHPVTHGVQLLCHLTAGLRHVGSDPCTGQNTFPLNPMNATAEARRHFGSPGCRFRSLNVGTARCGFPSSQRVVSAKPSERAALVGHRATGAEMGTPRPRAWRGRDRGGHRRRSHGVVEKETKTHTTPTFCP